jgi:enterochelin esterase family protein
MPLRFTPFALLGLMMLGTAHAQEPETPLAQGQPVQATLEAGQSRSFPLPGAEGDYLRGRLDAGRARLTLIDRDGKPERVLVPRGGLRQEFHIAIGPRGPYRLDVHADEPGPFTLAIESVVPVAQQGPTPETLESPRLRELQKSLADGATTDAFWQHVAEVDRGPILETDGVTPPLAPDTSLVTFVYRGAKRNARLFSAPSNDHDPMTRLGSSDVWYATYRVPNDARVFYKIAPDVPEIPGPPFARRRALLATVQRDPRNHRSWPASGLTDAYAGESLLEMPKAVTPACLVPREGVPSGTIEQHRFESQALGNTRDIFVYRPTGYAAGNPANALLIALDGDRYIDEVGAPQILDRLIADRAIPPTAAIFVANATADSRSTEMPCYPAFVRFLADELLPWARNQGLMAPADRTIIAGASYGGLAAVYAGWSRPDVFGRVLSQSGSFWWSPGSGPASMSPEAPEWLTRQIAASPKVPTRFHLEAGRFETGYPGSLGILDTTRHLRDVLVARGNTVTYSEPPGAHGFAYWRYSLGESLMALLAP